MGPVVSLSLFFFASSLTLAHPFWHATWFRINVSWVGGLGGGEQWTNSQRYQAHCTCTRAVLSSFVINAESYSLMKIAFSSSLLPWLSKPYFFQATRDTGYAGPSSALYHPLCCSPHFIATTTTIIITTLSIQVTKSRVHSHEKEWCATSTVVSIYLYSPLFLFLVLSLFFFTTAFLISNLIIISHFNYYGGQHRHVSPPFHQQCQCWGYGWHV